MADVDPFADDLQQADSRAPAEADLEQSLAQLLTSFSTLTNCVLSVDATATEAAMQTPGGLVGHTMSQIISQLKDLQSTAPGLKQAVIPTEVVSLIDAGKNPNLHMKNFVERTAAENQYTNAILSGTKDYQSDLNALLADAFPAIKNNLA